MGEKFAVVMATTHIDSHGDMLTIEALKGAAQHINSGSRPIATVNHNRTLLPYGTIVQAEVIQRSDGAYQLEAVVELFDKSDIIQHIDGTELIREYLESNKLPLANPYAESNHFEFNVSLDRTNFSTPEELKKFIDDIQCASKINTRFSSFGRKSSIPDPEVIITLGSFLSALFLSRKGIDKFAEKTGETAAQELIKLYDSIKSMAILAANRLRPFDRPITYVIVTHKNPHIELIAITRDPNTLMSSLSPEKLKEISTKALDLHNSFNADRIQFLLSNKGEWEFNYLLTCLGEAIGSPAALSRRTREFEMLTKPTKPRKRSQKKSSESATSQSGPSDKT